MICKEGKNPEPNNRGICLLCNPHRACRKCNDCGRFRPLQVLETYWINLKKGIRGYRCIQCSCVIDPEFGRIKVNCLMNVQR